MVATPSDWISIVLGLPAQLIGRPHMNLHSPKVEVGCERNLTFSAASSNVSNQSEGGGRARRLTGIFLAHTHQDRYAD
jgi:hypothetical protein